MAGQTGQIVHSATLQPEFGSERGRFGEDVRVSGDYAVVAGALAYNGSLRGSGEVYVLRRSGSQWALAQTLRPQGRPLTFFGSAVALADSLLFAGSFSEGPVDYNGTGFVDVYRLSDAGTWVYHATLRPPGSGVQYFGHALDYDGERLLVGAPATSGYRGRVLVYERVGDAWTLTATLASPAGSDANMFGDRVAIDGARAVVFESNQLQPVVHAFDLVDSTWTWRQLVTPPTGPYQSFGLVVDVDGDDLVVGARQEGFQFAGAVHAFRREGDAWTHVARLTDPGHVPQSGTRFFGHDVDLDGGRLVVGAPGSPGRAVLFDWSGSSWIYNTALDLTSPYSCDYDLFSCEYDEFGGAVAFDDATIVVGAPGTAYESPPDAGSVHVFEQAGAAWMPRADIVLGPYRNLHEFGSAVSISGGRVAIGAAAREGWSSAYVYTTSGTVPTLDVRRSHPYTSVTDVILDGASLLTTGTPTSLLYRRTASGWTHEYSLPSANAGDFDGHRMLLGTNRSTGPGWASLHEFTGTGWPRIAYLDALDSSFSFGADVALDGDRAYVGAPGIEAGPGARDGAVHVFEFDGLAWRYTLSLSSPDPALALTFGTAIAASGGRLLVGAPAASGRGAAWVYDGTAWMPVARFDGTTDADGFGTSVALDGSRALVGAPLASHPDAGTFAGQALAFAFTGQAWVPLGTLSSAAPRQNERFGTAVDVEGRRFAVGAPYPTPAADEFGAVYLFTDASTVAADDAPVAEARVVSPPVPNPAASGGAVVRLTLPQPDVVSAYVVDVLGRTVQTLAEREAVAADAQLRVETRALAPGRYVVRVAGTTFAESVALTVVR